MMKPSLDRGKLLVLAASALALTASLTACQGQENTGGAGPGTGSGTGSSPPEVSLPSGSSSKAPNGATAPNGGAPTGGAAPVGGGTRCQSGQLAAEMQEQDGSTETRTVSMLSLNNKSGRACTIPAGWAAMGLSDENGVYQPLQSTRQNYPGTGMNITVKPGQWVFASMKWTTDVECPDTKSFAVSWYSAWVAAPAKWNNGPRQLCPGTVVQGTLQPTRVGVNFG